MVKIYYFNTRCFCLTYTKIFVNKFLLWFTQNFKPYESNHLYIIYIFNTVIYICLILLNELSQLTCSDNLLLLCNGILLCSQWIRILLVIIYKMVVEMIASNDGKSTCRSFRR